MNLMLWLYAVDVVGGLGKFFVASTVVGGVASVICVFCAIGMADGSGSSDSEWRTWRRCAAMALAIFIPSLFLSIAIPKEKTLYLMMGAKTAQEIVANPRVQETGGMVMDMINKKLKAMVEEDDDDSGDKKKKK